MLLILPILYYTTNITTITSTITTTTTTTITVTVEKCNGSAVKYKHS